MAIDYEEKRDFIRMTADHVLHYREIGSEETRQGTCRNISASGILFTSDQAIPAGTELEINITPQFAVVSPLDAVVKVLRTQANGTPQHYTIAGMITSFSPS
jgi:hypothetical protein